MKILILSLLVLVHSSLVCAEVCESQMNARELFAKAIDRQIDVESLRKESGVIDGYIQHAGKLPNPELEHFTTSGQQWREHNITQETRLWFHIQTNNKRQKRADVYRTEKEMNEINIRFEQTKVARNLFLTILRHRQLLDEQERLNSFHDIIKELTVKYDRVEHLAAEQTFESASLDLAKEEIEFNQIQLQNELLGIRKYYQTVTQAECPVDLLLPAKNHNRWPDLSSVGFKSSLSFLTKLSELALEKSELEFKREQANAYPDIRIAPMWQYNELGAKPYNLFGVGFVVPLPIVDRNQGLKAATLANVERNKKRLDFNEQEIIREFNLNHQRYTALQKDVMQFQKKFDFQALMLKKKELFRRGLVSIPLFLTYKREQVGLINKVHMLELDLGNYLSEVLIINGAPLIDESMKVLSL